MPILILLISISSRFKSLIRRLRDRHLYLFQSIQSFGNSFKPDSTTASYEFMYKPHEVQSYFKVDANHPNGGAWVPPVVITNMVPWFLKSGNILWDGSTEKNLGKAGYRIVGVCNTPTGYVVMFLKNTSSYSTGMELDVVTYDTSFVAGTTYTHVFDMLSTAEIANGVFDNLFNGNFCLAGFYNNELYILKNIVYYSSSMVAGSGFRGQDLKTIPPNMMMKLNVTTWARTYERSTYLQWNTSSYIFAPYMVKNSNRIIEMEEFHLDKAIGCPTYLQPSSGGYAPAPVYYCSTGTVTIPYFPQLIMMDADYIYYSPKPGSYVGLKVN